jgi:tRNA threonylcarbamoyladenosine biosynthesis protein TsaB
MYTLAIELATQTGSVALAQSNGPTTETIFDEEQRASEQIFDVIRELLCANLPGGFEQLDRIIVGRGPGSYSGLRVAMTVAQGLALPGNTPCYALSSWAAAAAAAADAGGRQIIAIGDARRQRFWMGRFTARDGSIQQKEPFQLVPADELCAAIATTDLAMATDDITEEALGQQDIRYVRAAAPSAGRLLGVATQAIHAGHPSQPMTPIYIHPPVFVKPRFPATQTPTRP